MYRTRTERAQAERKKRQQRRRLAMVMSGSLLMVTAMAAAVFPLVKPDGQVKAPVQPRVTTPNQPAPAGTGHSAAPQENTVRLNFVGDIMMDGHVETLLKEKGYPYPFVHVTEPFRQDDVTVANLETPVAVKGTPETNKEYVYNSPPEAIPAMKAAGVDLVNLANNHSMDQGESGLVDTMKILEENGIAYVGAGSDADRAYAPVLLERNGVKIAFFGFSRVIPEVSWYAGKNKPGVAATYDPTKAVEAIRAVREQADLIVVVAHWGKEKTDYPVDHQKTLARAYIEAGADLVVGGHPHVLQGFESYRGKWIAYSLGNFVFTRSSHPKTWETMILQATCTKTGGCALKMMPHHAELGQAVPMNEADGAKLIKRIESISSGVQIDEEGHVRTR